MRRAAMDRPWGAWRAGTAAAGWVLAAGLLLGWSGPAAGFETTALGEFIFDIDDPDDMREVGARSGIDIRDDIDPAIGHVECRRWAAQFGVRPFRAVVSGYLPGRSLRVWICSGQADSQPLAEHYCRAMGMTYKTHDRAVVTCQIGEQS